MSTTLNSAVGDREPLAPPPAIASSLPLTAPPPVGDAAAAAAVLPEEDEAEDEVDDPRRVSRFVLFNAVPSSVVSAVVHFVAFLALALWSLEPKRVVETLAISAATPLPPEKVEQLDTDQLDIQLDAPAIEHLDGVKHVLTDLATVADAPAIVVDAEAAPPRVELHDFGEETAPKSDLMATIGALSGAGLTGRGDGERGRMVAELGGTPESEAAVAAALKWLAAHQLKDGGWSFDHRGGPCKGRCGDPGAYADCRTGATAMALLPFLGAGQTHREGQYKEVVDQGLYFLTNHMKVKKHGDLKTGDMTQGTSNDRGYAHPLAAIVLCEAYAMTNDPKLREPAQLAINYIVYAQDPVGGGWRYLPRQPGDTSVVGWQLMALKSAHMAYLVVPPSTVQGAMRFLDSTQALNGARYGYTGPGQGDAQTAIGLLCRIYLGWNQDHPALKDGVEHLCRQQPKMRPNLYFNYYATQVVRQYCGEPDSEHHELWMKWNKEMRDFLVKSQDKTGHSSGSWYFRGDHANDQGGRLYCTAMAAMILEVYYRHMPIYGKQAATEEFPL